MKKLSLMTVCVFFLAACLSAPGGEPPTPLYQTPDYQTADYQTPDYQTPDHQTADYQTPDYQTADYQTPDHQTADYQTPDYPAPNPTETPTPDTAPKPKIGVVEEGSFWAQAGVPVGMTVEKLEYPGDNLVKYFVFNPVNGREIIIGSKDKNGKVTPAEFLNYQLVSCYALLEEILANEVPEEVALSGVLNRLAMLNDSEPFPEDVLLGQKIEVHHNQLWKNDFSKQIGRINGLRWGREAQRKFDADPEKMPHRLVGCYSFRSSLDSEHLYIALVHKWQNPDRSYRYITTIIRGDFYSESPPDQYVFVYGWLELFDGEEISDKLIQEILTDPERNAILDQWVKDQAVPYQAENSIFNVMGPERNYRK